MPSCLEFRQALGPLWPRALQPAFVKACANSTITGEQFNKWVQQDYYFVIAFTRLVGQILSKAPVEHFEGILQGLSALSNELAWFREKAAERGIALDAPVHPVCKRYIDLLASLPEQPYFVLASCLWAIEYVYNQAWQVGCMMPAPYREFAERWGSPEFSKYVEELQRQADEAMKDIDQESFEKASDAISQIFKVEEQFWALAMDDNHDS